VDKRDNSVGNAKGTGGWGKSSWDPRVRRCRGVARAVDISSGRACRCCQYYDSHRREVPGCGVELGGGSRGRFLNESYLVSLNDRKRIAVLGKAHLIWGPETVDSPD
jgi:hypothetical protein